MCTGTLTVAIIMQTLLMPKDLMFLIIKLLEILVNWKSSNNTIVVQAHPSNNNTVISRITRANVDNQPAHQEGTLIVAVRTSFDNHT